MALDIIARRRGSKADAGNGRAPRFRPGDERASVRLRKADSGEPKEPMGVSVKSRSGSAPSDGAAGPGANRRAASHLGRRTPRRATPQYLRNAALHHLERYATSTAHLRRLLARKVARSAAAHGTDEAAGLRAVDELIADLLRLGLLDDAAYAEARARALHRRGQSLRAIRAALAQRGVAAEIVERALAALAEQAAEPDLAAALAYARRRRIGPYRNEPAARDEPEARKRELAALGRRGFSYEIARRIVEASGPEDLADLEAEAQG